MRDGDADVDSTHNASDASLLIHQNGHNIILDNSPKTALDATLDADARRFINDIGDKVGGVSAVELGGETDVEDGIISLEANDDFAMGQSRREKWFSHNLKGEGEQFYQISHLEQSVPTFLLFCQPQAVPLETPGGH
jgi:hypothetical protein